METVDELETQGNQQRHAEQQERRPRGDYRAEFVHVVHQAVSGEQHSHRQHGEKDHVGKRAGFLVEGWPATVGGRGAGGQGGSSHGRTILSEGRNVAHDRCRMLQRDCAMSVFG
ncbi:hypothetical protein D3C72_1720670 [compost metagenome]